MDPAPDDTEQRPRAAPLTRDSETCGTKGGKPHTCGGLGLCGLTPVRHTAVSTLPVFSIFGKGIPFHNYCIYRINSKRVKTLSRKSNRHAYRVVKAKN